MPKSCRAFGCSLPHVFVIEDEHDEMHRQELLAREYEAQLESERTANQAKSLFFSTVSHDIRTPLNALPASSSSTTRPSTAWCSRPCWREAA